MLSEAIDYSHLADDDPTAPWNTDPTYGGMTPGAARKSYQANAQREAAKATASPDNDNEPSWRGGKPGSDGAAGPRQAALPPLTIAEWLARDLEPPDYVMGAWLTTTSRTLLVAPTGLGKTNFAMALAIAVAAGGDFLHWSGCRPCKVLYIDGEMSRRVLRQRLADAVARLGSQPAGFFALSREDVDDMPPLNTAGGQAYIERIIASKGGIDLIVFDSIMCLLVGDMKDGEMWASVMPWVRALTKRKTAQIWVHHTGHDATRSYGDKTKEWQLDNVVYLEPAEHPEARICFNLSFRKGRERTDANDNDFRSARVMLHADVWSSDGGTAGGRAHVSPLGRKFFGALTDAIAGDRLATTVAGRPATTLDSWKNECVRLGLIDPAERPDSARNLFNKHRRELIAANYIACNGERVWVV